MNDPYDILDCALQSRYLTLADLPKASVWHHLPAQLRSALASALDEGEPLGTVLRLVWQVRARHLDKPSADRAGEQTRATAELRLGLLHLRYREGRIGADELLTRAFHVADSYVCSVDGRPFLQLRRELQAGRLSGSAAARVADVFAPYTELAAQCVERWGLGIRCRGSH